MIQLIFKFVSPRVMFVLFYFDLPDMLVYNIPFSKRSVVGITRSSARACRKRPKYLQCGTTGNKVSMQILRGCDEQEQLSRGTEYFCWTPSERSRRVVYHHNGPCTRPSDPCASFRCLGAIKVEGKRWLHCISEGTYEWCGRGPYEKREGIESM